MVVGEQRVELPHHQGRLRAILLRIHVGAEAFDRHDPPRLQAARLVHTPKGPLANLIKGREGGWQTQTKVTRRAGGVSSGIHVLTDPHTTA